MPVLDLNTNKNPISALSSKGPLASGEGGPLSWIQQANQFINSLTTLMNTINNNPLLGQITGARANGGDMVIRSGPGAKTMKNVTPAQSQNMNSGIDEASMMQYFSTPEGLSKIADAIEQVIPFTGDIKLSALKSEIKKLSGSVETAAQTVKGETAQDPTKTSKPKTGGRKRVKKKKTS